MGTSQSLSSGQGSGARDSQHQVVPSREPYLKRFLLDEQIPNYRGGPSRDGGVIQSPVGSLVPGPSGGLGKPTPGPPTSESHLPGQPVRTLPGH